MFLLHIHSIFSEEIKWNVGGTSTGTSTIIRYLDTPDKDLFDLHLLPSIMIPRVNTHHGNVQQKDQKTIL
jgi:hypothetical protein